MGLIHIDLFTTLDGVAQAPGGPDEDSENGFEFGGWQAPLLDEASNDQIEAAMDGMDALLLGRKTYDIFASYWPNVREGFVAELFNRIPKYVASRSPQTPEWAGTTQLNPDIRAAVGELRDRHQHIHVFGSLNFVQTLFAEQLFDTLTLWVHPIVLGQGKKVFAGGEVPTSLTLLEPAATSPSGVVQLQYGIAEGVPKVGTIDA